MSDDEATTTSEKGTYGLVGFSTAEYNYIKTSEKVVIQCKKTLKEYEEGMTYNDMLLIADPRQTVSLDAILYCKIKIVIPTRYTLYTDEFKIVSIPDGATIINDILYRFSNAVLHSTTYPAIEYANTAIWYKNGLRHCDNGPAIVSQNHTNKSGIYSWYNNGKLHREDGPAVIKYETRGGKLFTTHKWYAAGELNRSEGPAVEEFSPSGKVIEYGWFVKGELHRDGGPAYKDAHDTIKWYKNGKLHREDGPAIIEQDCSIWCRNDLTHRDDGPAVEWASGLKEWYFNGHRVTEDIITNLYKDT